MAKHGLVAVAFLALLALATLRAQDAADEPAFEAASIKESRGLPTMPQVPGRFTRPNITVSLVLVYAYQMSEFQIQGGPDWVRTRRFDIDAKAPRIVPGEDRKSVV